MNRDACGRWLNMIYGAGVCEEGLKKITKRLGKDIRAAFETETSRTRSKCV